MTRNTPNSKSMNKYRAPAPFGSGQVGPLEVTREEGFATASGIAHPPSARPTRLTVNYDGATLSITAAYPQTGGGPIEGAISLPLDLRDPSQLLPLLEGEHPWKAWPDIEALVRQAFVDLQIPRRLTGIFERHLHILRAVRNGPRVSKLLRTFATEEERSHALFMLPEQLLNDKIAGSIKQMQEVLEIASAPASVLDGYGNAMRHYQELNHEKQKREGRSEYERMNEELRRLEEENRSRMRMKGAKAHRT